MQMRQLGAGGPEISVVGFGAWEAGGAHWGPNSSEQEVTAAIHAGLDAGMTWVDTAEVYGNGVSERIVGRAVAGRDDVLVFTKVAPDEGSGLAAGQVRGAIDASLRRLGRDHVDLYQVHWPSDDVPIEETWGAMADLVAAGKARWIGVSNFDRALIERCQAIHPVASLQNEFSLLHRGDRDELLPWTTSSATTTGAAVAGSTPRGGRRTASGPSTPGRWRRPRPWSTGCGRWPSSAARPSPSWRFAGRWSRPASRP
jgi:aryl-alcohol dehydrogenase-like predicted oxidoreductase